MPRSSIYILLPFRHLSAINFAERSCRTWIFHCLLILLITKSQRESMNGEGGGGWLRSYFKSNQISCKAWKSLHWDIFTNQNIGAKRNSKLSPALWEFLPWGEEIWRYEKESERDENMFTAKSDLLRRDVFMFRQHHNLCQGQTAF